MTDREKVIERLGKVSYYFKSLRAVGWQGDADIYREHQESVNMAIALLKEQESEVAIVRCKDCIYRPTVVEGHHGTYYDFPHEGKCPCQCDDDWYSWMPDDDWFCANGERVVKPDAVG
jgi:hypothetical protein